MEKIPRVGVATFVVNNDGMFLMGKRKGSSGAGSFALPGGKLDYGEEIETCAAREILEETGMTLHKVHLCGYTNDFFEVFFVFSFSAFLLLLLPGFPLDNLIHSSND